MSTEPKIYRTSSYPKAAFFLCRDILPEVLPNPKRPQKAEFTAPITPELLRALADYEADAPVPVKTFIENIEVIKDKMMAVTRRGGAR
jgi:hypothetical protein